MVSSLGIFLFPLSLLLPIYSLAQTTNGNITIGASLFAAENSSSWLSASGDFAFGFRPIEIDQDILFLLCIWYAKIPDKTIVWYANGDLPAQRESKVSLTAGTNPH
ncbi:hypothetical protein PanWU01x14_235330 [Parasponia andersonii]|uniref:Bulb-type lectin domain containing protein n=1 Tax=Parasponia andersonii TaxID=3476 RepID=A0A2P5BJ57_PARAD|nr:hypothetical protein PanWU01x14_235330 [Parasponia andersonii]